MGLCEQELVALSSSVYCLVRLICVNCVHIADTQHLLLLLDDGLRRPPPGALVPSTGGSTVQDPPRPLLDPSGL